jgi:HAD superfamily hydrolase (TIGR01484 family)
MNDYQHFKQPIKYLFTDIDDTLTNDGKLLAKPYEMLWKLAESGIQIIPITGRPAGWCEMIARFWPVHSVIGENGAFYFSYQNKKMKRHFFIDEEQRLENQKKLQQIELEVLEKIPQAATSSDQFTRLFDLAIDFCEDVQPLNSEKIDQIVQVFETHGAKAKVSSIHVNGWFGDYDKRSMCEVFFEKEFKRTLAEDQQDCVFVGDSPNDEPMFGFFQNSFAVANIQKFLDQLKMPPKYSIPKLGGEGFTLLADHLIKYS